MNKHVLASMLLMAASAARAQKTKVAARSSVGDLKAVQQEYEAAPSDEKLEKLLKTAAKTKPLPAVPETARAALVRGNAVIKAATGVTDYDTAIGHFHEAQKSAPWWAEPYFNESKAQELAKRYTEAKIALQRYLWAKPAALNARALQDKVYELEGLASKAVQDQAEAARQAQQRADEQAQENIRRQQAAANPDLTGKWYPQTGGEALFVLFNTGGIYSGAPGSATISGANYTGTMLLKDLSVSGRSVNFTTEGILTYTSGVNTTIINNYHLTLAPDNQRLVGGHHMSITTNGIAQDYDDVFIRR